MLYERLKSFLTLFGIQIFSIHVSTKVISPNKPLTIQVRYPSLSSPLMRHRILRRCVDVASPGSFEVLSRACLDFGFMVVVMGTELVPAVIDVLVVFRIIVLAQAGGRGTASAADREKVRKAPDHGPEGMLPDEGSVGGQACGNDGSAGLELGPERRVDSNRGLVLRACNEDSVELEMSVVKAHRGTDDDEDTQPENGVDFDLLGPF